MSADVALRWIAYWRDHETTGRFPDSDDGQQLEILARQDPDLAWEAILFVLERIPADPSNTVFQVLAAGPLEDLLVHHGVKVVDRVDVEARRNPAFRLLFNGVWRSSIQPAVWARLEKYRTKVW